MRWDGGRGTGGMQGCLGMVSVLSQITPAQDMSKVGIWGRLENCDSTLSCDSFYQASILIWGPGF